MRHMRALKSYGLALVLIVAGALWLGTGLFVQGGNGPQDGERTVVGAIEGADGGPLTSIAEATGLLREVEHEDGAENPALSIAERNEMLGQEDSELRSVRTRLFTVQPMQMDVTLRGHTASPATRDAVAQTSDTIAEVHVTEGQQVQAGDLICTLSTGTRSAAVETANAAVAQAEAALAKAQTDFDTNERLRASGIASPNSAEGVAAALRLAEANLESARVQLETRQDELAHTELRATAAGIVQRPIAKVGDLIAMGGSCAAIVQLDPMRFVGAVPQSYIQLAHVGLPAHVTTINGQEADGTVTYVAVSADPATRSFDVEVEFANPGGTILDGLSAEAEIQLGTVPAHLLPPSALTLAADGTLGVQTVVDSKVVFRSVDLLKDTPDGMWLGGLPAQAEVIIIGQEYVVEGETVDADRQG